MANYEWCRLLNCPEHGEWFICYECESTRRPMKHKVLFKHHNNFHTTSQKRARKEAAAAQDADCFDTGDADDAGPVLSDAFLSFRKYYGLSDSISPSIDTPHSSASLVTKLYNQRERASGNQRWFHSPAGLPTGLPSVVTGWQAIMSQSVSGTDNPLLLTFTREQQELHLLFAQLSFQLPVIGRARLARLTSVVDAQARDAAALSLASARDAVTRCLEYLEKEQVHLSASDKEGS